MLKSIHSQYTPFPKGIMYVCVSHIPTPLGSGAPESYFRAVVISGTVVANWGKEGICEEDTA